jgi:hypothetical protein
MSFSIRNIPRVPTKEAYVYGRVIGLDEFSAYWSIVLFGHCFVNCKRSLKFWATFFHGKSFASNLTKTGFATLWVIFHTDLVTLVYRITFAKTFVNQQEYSS